MLQDIRQNIQGTIAKIIIGLIVISFSIFGIESLLFSPGGNAVAEVNGEEISPFDLQQETFLLQRQLLAMLGANADPALLDSAQLNEQALQSLVDRRLYMQVAEDLDLAVSNQSLGQVIASMEEFQLDGQFSVDLYQSRLATAGFTQASFRERLGQDLLQSQLRAGLAGSSFATESELAAAARVTAEGRDLRYITLPLDSYLETVELSDEAVAAYYEANRDRFLSAESVDVEYLELDLESYRQPVEEARLREEFELVRNEYEQAEESRVSHILFEGDADQRAERLAAARAAIEAGTSFADAAREFSDDVGSAGDGGDLGYTAGDAFPEAMEEAIAELAVGAVGTVETDAGTHLLLVTDRRAGTDVRFEDVRMELQDRLQTADASAALLLDVERLRDIAFNAADLSEPAAELGLEVSRASGVTRDAGAGLFSEPALRRAAFSEDVLDAGHNSEVIELSPERFVVLRVAQRRAPEALALGEVRGQIETALRDEQARAAARGTAADLLAALEGGATVETAANEAGLDWQVELGARRDSPRLPPQLRERAFALVGPAQGAAVREIVDAGDTLYVLELFRVTPGSLAMLSDDEQLALRQRLTGEEAGVLLRQYQAALRDRADITVY